MAEIPHRFAPLTLPPPIPLVVTALLSLMVEVPWEGAGEKGAGGTSTQSIGIVKLTIRAGHRVTVHEHDETCWRAHVVSE